jgi:hypothetical protein
MGTENGKEMEEVALKVVRASTHLLNDNTSAHLVEGMESLLERPLKSLETVWDI